MKFEKLLALSLAVVPALVACEVDECNEAGVCEGADGGGVGGEGGEGGMGGEGGEGGEGGAPAADLRWVLIIDVSEEENMAGTAGADICGVTATCAGADVPSVGALLTQGEGSLCTETGPDCSTDRTAPTAAQDDGASCEADSNPSDYVSLGMTGTLSVDFGQDLSGCTINVVELVGNQKEGYEVFACTDNNTDAGTCLNDAPLGGAAEGGDAEVAIP